MEGKNRGLTSKAADEIFEVASNRELNAITIINSSDVNNAQNANLNSIISTVNSSEQANQSVINNKSEVDNVKNATLIDNMDYIQLNDNNPENDALLNEQLTDNDKKFISILKYVYDKSKKISGIFRKVLWFIISRSFGLVFNLIAATESLILSIVKIPYNFVKDFIYFMKNTYTNMDFTELTKEQYKARENVKIFYN
jgi:hypothetical protein